MSTQSISPERQDVPEFGLEITQLEAIYDGWFGAYKADGFVDYEQLIVRAVEDNEAKAALVIQTSGYLALMALDHTAGNPATAYIRACDAVINLDPDQIKPGEDSLDNILAVALGAMSLDSALNEVVEPVETVSNVVDLADYRKAVSEKHEPAKGFATNRIGRTEGKTDSETDVEFLERFGSDLSKLRVEKVSQDELVTFLEMLPEWQYSEARIAGRIFTLLHRSVPENLDFATFVERDGQRAISWKDSTLTVLVKDMMLSDLTKRIDIEHSVAVHSHTGLISQESHTGNVAKANTLRSQENQVVSMILQSTKDIALDLNISPSTVRTHVHNALIKLGVDNRRELAIFGALTGLIDMEQVPSGLTKKLSNREREVLSEYYGVSYKEAANGLGLSNSTIRTIWHNIFKKLGAEDRTQAALVAIKDGIIEPTRTGLVNQDIPTTSSAP